MGIARQSPPSAELVVFSDRLCKAIEFKKIDVAALAKDSEYKSEDIHKMLKGMKEPGLKKLTLLANSLGCSVDYLLGLGPTPQRASVVVEVDTDAIKHQPSERGQTSGQISGNVEQIIALLPKLFESDVELIRFIIEFFVEKRANRVSTFMNPLIRKPSKETESIPKETPSKSNDDLADDDFDEEDDLWDAIEDDELKDEDWEEDEDDLESDDEDDFDDFDE
jgi:transcriptional regulator with XRE-family HTH domain